MSSVSSLPGTKTGYVIAAVLFVVLVLLLVAVWKNATLGASGGAFGGAFGSAFGGAFGDALDFDECEGGARPVRVMMRPPAFAAFQKNKRGVAARLYRSPFNQIAAGDEIEVRRSRAPGDLTEYGEPRAVAATVTAVETFGSYAELVKKVGHEEFGAASAAAATKALEEFGVPGGDEKVIAVHLKYVGEATRRN